MACEHKGMLYLCNLCNIYHCSDCDWNLCTKCKSFVCDIKYYKEKKVCKQCDRRENGILTFREPYYINPFRIYKPSITSLFGD